MHISAKGNYGLRAVLDLALHYGEGNVQSSEIAARQEIPESYLVQLLNLLRKAGAIHSVRGPKGGHSLAKHPDELTVGEVVAVLEGPVDLLAGDLWEKGHRPETDVLRDVWEEVGTAMHGVLASITFGDLCRKYGMKQAGPVFRI
jgi:Rrf2 family protein